jgi:hypothetical protein
MGLLGKTLSLRKKEKQKENGGLLSRALAYESSGEGDSSRRSDERRTHGEEQEEAEQPRGKGEGLLERAAALVTSEESGARGPEKRSGSGGTGAGGVSSIDVTPLRLEDVEKQQEEEPMEPELSAAGTSGETRAEETAEPETAAAAQAVPPSKPERPPEEPAVRTEEEKVAPWGGLLARAARLQTGVEAAKVPMPEGPEASGPAVSEPIAAEPAVSEPAAAEPAVESPEITAPEAEVSEWELPETEAVEMEAPEAEAETATAGTEAIAGVPEEAAVEEAEARPAGGEPPAEEQLRTAPERLFEYRGENDAVRILGDFDEIVRTEGYTAFITELAERFLRQGRGKALLLYLTQGERYTAEYCFPESPELKKTARKSVKKGSVFVDYLAAHTEPLRSTGIRNGDLRKETAFFNQIEPWTALALSEGTDLTGFVVVGHQPKKPRLDSQPLVLLSRLAAGYLGRYRMEQIYARNMEKKEEESESRRNLLDLYNTAEVSDLTFTGALDRMCRMLGIESAVYVTGWETKGSLTIPHSVGMTEELLKRYKISKSDKELRSIIEGRVPAAPKDAKKRVEKLACDTTQLVKTYLVAPVYFGEQLLGVLNIHRMKGAGLKISAAARERVAHGTGSLVPFFLQSEIDEADPFGTLVRFLDESMAEARRERKSLHFVLFTLETDGKTDEAVPQPVIGDSANKLFEIVRSQEAAVKRIDLRRTLLEAEGLEDVEADEIIKQVSKEFRKYLVRKKLAENVSLGTHIVRFPQECRNTRAVLEWIYGVP